MPSVWGSASKELQHIDEVGADNGVAADAHAGALADPQQGELMHRFIGQGAAAGDQAHGAGPVDMPGHDAHLSLARGDDARAVGADEAAVRILQAGHHPHHVQGGNALGDAHHHLDPAAADSRMASAAKAGGTKIREVLAPVAFTAWATVLNTGTSSIF